MREHISCTASGSFAFQTRNGGLLIFCPDIPNQTPSSYAALLGAGRLTASQIGLNVAEHRPEEHYEAVKDKWIGIRTPDGR